MEIKDGNPKYLIRAIQWRILGRTAAALVAGVMPMEGREDECSVRIVDGVRESAEDGIVDL